MKTTQFWSGCQIRNLRKSGSLPGEPAVVTNCDGRVQLNVTTNPDSKTLLKNFCILQFFSLSRVPQSMWQLILLVKTLLRNFCILQKFSWVSPPVQKLPPSGNAQKQENRTNFSFVASRIFWTNFSPIGEQTLVDVLVAIFANRRTMSISLRQFFLR